MKEYIKPSGIYITLCSDEAFAVGSCTGSCHDAKGTIVPFGPDAKHAC